MGAQDSALIENGLGAHFHPSLAQLIYSELFISLFCSAAYLQEFKSKLDQLWSTLDQPWIHPIHLILSGFYQSKIRSKWIHDGFSLATKQGCWNHGLIIMDITTINWYHHQLRITEKKIHPCSAPCMNERNMPPIRLWEGLAFPQDILCANHSLDGRRAYHSM